MEIKPLSAGPEEDQKKATALTVDVLIFIHFCLMGFLR
jgi:hypothetical protein